MKPARNALIGYTYQEQITFLFLAKMDVEREIETIEMEADVSHNFDDTIIVINGETIVIQIKDIDNISLEDLNFSKDVISIKGKKQRISKNAINAVFLKNINIVPNDSFLGLPAIKKGGIYIISLSRAEVDDLIRNFYEKDIKRILKINRFFQALLDSRNYVVSRDDLPIVDIFDTKLIEKSIDIGRKHLEFSNILFIEGKPGVGKSHYVNKLAKIYKKNIIYRLWISNQDKDYKARLIFDNFLTDLSKKLFNDYTIREEKEIIEKIEQSNFVFILDGLDHVENYNKEDFNKFINFINKLHINIKSIVLSRPLKYKIAWDRQTLGNWNENDTKKVLNELFHISDYDIYKEIYNLTNGYPILVRFVGEHFKINKTIPNLNNLKSIEDYYNQVIKDVKTRTALTLFLTSQSFFMKSEFEMFLSDELLDYINEFIEAYPYLFEIKLNRVSLFHDSFNKFLRELNINFSKREEKTHHIVYESIMRKDKRFMSRFSYFNLKLDFKRNIILYFSSIQIYQEIIQNCIDFEALRTFYNQVRESLYEISPKDLEVINYYDLSLILNTILRDHISTQNDFLYTYVKCLIFNGYTSEDITSTEYLFSMFIYFLERDAIPLYNITSDSHFDTSRLLEELKVDIELEDEFFNKYSKPIKLKKSVSKYIEDDYNWREYLTQILTNLYIHKTNQQSLLIFQNCIDTFINNNEKAGILILKGILSKYNERRDFPHWILNNVKRNLLSLGKLPKENQYLNLSLKDYILKNKTFGSFDMLANVLSYLRLSLNRKQKIDVNSIGHFFSMYYMRKDYTVINIHEALKVFEENELQDEIESVEQINVIQSMSEKGVRHLLTDYMSIKEPLFVERIIHYNQVYDLNITWFNLPSKHINIFPDEVFSYAVSQMLQQNSYRKEIDFRDIKNVFHSSKWKKLADALMVRGYKVIISKKSLVINKLKNLNPKLIVYKKEDDFENDIEEKHDPDTQDILTEKKQSLIELSKSLDENYSVLSDLSKFKEFSSYEISQNLEEIFYFALIGQSTSVKTYGSPFHLVGYIPRLVNDYDLNPNIKELNRSFNTFLDLSLLNINNNEDFH